MNTFFFFLIIQPPFFWERDIEMVAFNHKLGKGIVYLSADMMDSFWERCTTHRTMLDIWAVLPLSTKKNYPPLKDLSETEPKKSGVTNFRNDKRLLIRKCKVRGGKNWKC